MRKLVALGLILWLGLGCMKQDVIQRNLWSDGGVWKITNLKDNGGNVPVDIDNPGTVFFAQNKTGRMIVTILWVTEETKFTYSNTANKLTIVNKTEGSDKYGETTVFNMIWQKDKMTLSNEDAIIQLKKD